MKKILLIIFTCISINVFSNSGNNTITDTLITQLQSINLDRYIGKPVDSLINHLPSGYTELTITGWRSIRVAEILNVVYSNKIVVEIHVRQFQYVNPNWVNTANPKQNWDVTLFKKESIAFTVIFKGGECINGCENKNK